MQLAENKRRTGSKINVSHFAKECSAEPTMDRSGDNGFIKILFISPE